MKKLLLPIMALAALSACKKSTDNKPAGVQVEVSGLTSKTSLTLKINDVTQGTLILNLSNQFGNTTYTTNSVNHGDHLSITYNTNIPDNPQGDGDGTIKLFYKGANIGTIGGILTGSTTATIP